MLNVTTTGLLKEMMMKRYLILIAFLAAILLVILTTRTVAVPPDSPKSEFAPKAPEPNLLKFPSRKEAMVMKLKSSQGILEGIALNDFDKIESAARELIAVSNYTDFLNAFKGPEYAFHVQIFRRPVETIARKAKDKNMDGVMMAYNDMTLSCLKCHQAMRDNKFEVNLEKLEKLDNPRRD
ncbi:hypothetical protein BH11PLA2_BH11PLA2_09770 [soil metagenome]